MIQPSDGQKRYASAKHRFLKALLMDFFAQQFPKLFGPIIRQKIAEELMALFEAGAPETKRLKSGQILWNALDKNTRGNAPQRSYVPVVLSIITPEDIEALTQGVTMSKITEQAIARIIREAYHQGGILSMRDIGLLLLRAPSTISVMRQRYEKNHHCTLPHTGTLHDMGSCVSHKRTILTKVILEKKDPADVARETHHTQEAVDRYLKDYHRVKIGYQQNPDLDYIHLVTGMAKHVIKQYLEILEKST